MGTGVQTRELPEMPSSSGSNTRKESPNAQSQCGDLLLFLPLCFSSSLPFFPSLSSLLLCSSPQQSCGIQSHKPSGAKTMREGNLLHAMVLSFPKAGTNLHCFFYSLCPLFLCLANMYVGKVIDVYSRRSFLAQRLKSVPRRPKSSREIMKRKELGKATP